MNNNPNIVKYTSWKLLNWRALGNNQHLYTYECTGYDARGVLWQFVEKRRSVLHDNGAASLLMPRQHSFVRIEERGNHDD